METTNKSKGNGLAIASMVCGIIAFLVSFIPCISLACVPCAMIAIVFGIIHIVGSLQTGNKIGMSVAGLACGVCAFIVMIGWGISFYNAINKTSNTINDNIPNISKAVKEIVEAASNDAFHDAIILNKKGLDFDSTTFNKFEDMLNELEENE